MSANELAQNVNNFITHNNIDINKFSMDQIVEAYFAKQLEAIDAAAEELTRH